MEQAPAVVQQNLPFSPEEWDELRESLKDSVIAKTNLCSLAKDLGYKWPIRADDEIPQKYLGYKLPVLADLPEFYGKGNRLPLLRSILEDARQMDDPFADMVEQFDSTPADESAVRTPLEKMGVPMSYPVELMMFSDRTLDICADGGHETIGQLIYFITTSQTAVIMNEEFRQFLTCVESHDIEGLRQYLPIRKGSEGIHLAEAIGLVAKRLTEKQAASLLYAYKIETQRPEWGESAVMSKDRTLELINDVKGVVGKCFKEMSDQEHQLRKAIEDGVNTGIRYFVSLNDPNLESLARAVAMAALDEKPRFKGLIGRFL